MKHLLTRLIERSTGEPMPPNTHPGRLIVAATAIAAVVYVVLTLALGLNP